MLDSFNRHTLNENALDETRIRMQMTKSGPAELQGLVACRRKEMRNKSTTIEKNFLCRREESSRYKLFACAFGRSKKHQLVMFSGMKNHRLATS